MNRTKKLIFDSAIRIFSECGYRGATMDDIALNAGEPIYAIFDGEIIEADYDQWNGNYIKIKHDNNIISVYCHCSKLFVKKGDVIRGGEVIAQVGSTGQSTGPHIHFEIRINDISYNPSFALKDAKDAV